jgi:hypothetical protein
MKFQRAFRPAPDEQKAADGARKFQARAADFFSAAYGLVYSIA